MGKGNRNRQNRETLPNEATAKAAPKKKKSRQRKPLSAKAKSIIEYAVALVLVLAIVAGSLISAGTFKRGNVLVHSKTGDYDLNQQMATYIVWDSLYYQAYYLWQYYQSSIQSSTGITDQATYCLTYAMSGVQDTLLTSINENADTLKSYVAVCDIAAELGVTLSKEEIKDAEQQAEEQMESIASSLYYSSKRFIKTFIGNNVKLKDIKAVARMQALYTKVMGGEESKLKDSITDEILKKYRDENPESFYSTDYLSYEVKSTDKDELVEKLLAATTSKEFKIVLATNEFENGTANFKKVFNENTVLSEAGTLKAALSGKNEETLTKAIADAKTADDGKEAWLTDETIQSYTKEAAKAINEDLSNWMFDSTRKAFDTGLIESGDKAYVVVLSTAPANDTVNALYKEYTLSDGSTFGEDTNFKNNILATLLVQLELKDKVEVKAEELTIYDDLKTEDENDQIIDQILVELNKAMTKVIPTTTTQMYVAEPDADTFQDWMFNKDSIAAPEDATAGKTKKISKTTNNEDGTTKTVNTVYFIEEAMKYDTKPLVDGGYLEFNETDHAADADAFFKTLDGLTGAALAEAFSLNADAQISEAISSEDKLDANLSAWLFDEARQAGDKAIVTATGKTYVAFFNGSVPTWEYSSENGYINDNLTEWLEDLREGYLMEQKGLKRIKDRNPVETTEA